MDEGRELALVFTVVSKVINNTKEGNLNKQLMEIQKLLEELADLVSDNLPQELPLIKSIEHVINLVPSITLLNSSAYRMLLVQ